MRKATFINKHSTSGDPSRLTPHQRRQVNERSREHRRGTRNAGRPSKGPGASPETSAVVKVDRSIGGVDPFEVLTVPLNRTVVAILQYYKEVYYARTWQAVHANLHGQVSIDSLVVCTPERVIMESLDSGSRMKCLLADVGAHLSQAQNEIEVQPWALLQRGTTALKNELSTRGVDAGEETLCNALHLCLATSALQEEKSLAAHVAGVRAIIENIVTRGTKIGKAMAALLSLVDIGVSQRLLADGSGMVEEMMPQAGWVHQVAFGQLNDIPKLARPSLAAGLGLPGSA